MKKSPLSIVILVFILLLGLAMAFSLTACGKGNETDASETESASNDTPTAEANSVSPENSEEDSVLPPHTVDMTAEELWSSYKEFSEPLNLSEITLEKMQDFIGVDAEKSDEQSDTWVKYQWYTTDGGGLVLLLNKDTGAFISASQAYPPSQ